MKIFRELNEPSGISKSLSGIGSIRYDFGKYTEGNKIDDIWKRYVVDMDEHVLFSDDEYSEIHNLVKQVQNQRIYDNRGHIYLNFKITLITPSPHLSFPIVRYQIQIVQNSDSMVLRHCPF